MDVVIPYDPRPHQRVAWDQLRRFSVLVWHRRAGKTVFAINALLRQVLENPRPDARGIYVAPTYKQAKRIAWSYLRQFAGVIPGTRFLEQELRCLIPGGKEIWLLGADNPDALRGIFVDHGVLDEVGQMSPRIWGEVLRPALADRGGGALFIGTPFGPANLFAQMYEQAGSTPDWARSMLKVTETGALPAAEIEALRREMSTEEWQQEMECSFNAAVRGAYYGSLMDQAETDGRITRVPHDPAVAVHTSWDLGIANRTVVWCWQTVGAEIRAIDCLAFANTGLPQIVQELRARPYAYGTHYAPHDAAARELGSGKSRLEMAKALGLTWTLTPQLSVLDGIDATRAMLPRVWFDADRCREGIQALRLYRTEWDPDKRVFSRNPLHDWCSDYADSVRMFAVGTQGRRPGNQPLDYSAIDRMFAA